MRALLLIGLWSAQALAGATLGPEQSFEAPVYGKLPVWVESARLAHGNGVSLLVWADDRRGDRSAYYGTGPDIYATRLDADGNVLDPAGIPICVASFSQEAPVVAWDGTAFVIAWQDYRDNQQYAIWSARVLPDGTVATPADGALVAAPGVNGGWFVTPEIASDGTATWIVWNTEYGTRTTGMDILGARLSSAGTLLDTTPVVLSNAEGDQSSPAIAAGPSGRFLVAWSDARNRSTGSWIDVYGTRVTGDGQVLDTAGLAISAIPTSAHRNPRAAFDGTNWVVAWKDNRDSHDELYAGRVQPSDGAALDGDGVRLTTRYTYKSPPAVAFDGTDTWVTWIDDGNDWVYGVRFTGGGTLRDTTPFSLFDAWSGTIQALASAGTRLWSVWVQNGVAKVGRFDSDGTLVDAAGRDRAWGPNRQDRPIAASIGATSLLAWVDTRGTDSLTTGVRLLRLDAAGAPVGASWELTQAGSPGRMVIGASATAYLIAWVDSLNRILAVRVLPDGTVLDAAPIQIPSSFAPDGPTSIASDGTNWFIVWGSANIYGAFVRGNGTTTSIITINAATGEQRDPSVAFNGTDYLVAWTDGRISYENEDIYATRVTASGLVRDGDGFPIVQAASIQREAHVAFHGDFFVTWIDFRTSGGIGEVRAARVRSDATVLDPGGILVDGSYGVRSIPQPVYDGYAFVVTWQQGPPAFQGLAMNRVTTDGQVELPAPVELWPWADNARSVTLLPAGLETLFATYVRFDGADGLHMDRVHGRSVTFERTAPPDAGVPDAGVPDSGIPDAGTPGDAGVEEDAGTQTDAGQTDAGESDAGQTDAGQTDAGQTDAGQIDAGQIDAGQGDGGVNGGGEQPRTCGCSATGVSTAALFLLLALTVRRNRRERG